MKGFKRRPLRLNLLAPAIALIAATTMIPTGLRHPSLQYIDNNLSPADLVNNVLLYIPLGIALGGSSILRAFLFGLGLATGAELLQLGYIDRVPSFLDITSNTCGAVVGYLVATQWIRITGHDTKSLPVSRLAGAVAVALGTLGTLMLVHRRPETGFSNWNPAFHLAIGNELTGNRPWAGTVSQFAIYPFAMPPETIHAWAEPLADSQQSPALPAGGLLPPLPADAPRGRPLYSPQQEHALFEALVQQGRLTLLVQMRPDNLEQNGPARVLTYSQDGINRNFTLGQLRDTLTFRLRTPDTGRNGSNPALFSGPVLSQHHTSFVAAVYDGRHSILYVDGEQVARNDLGAKRPRLPKRLLGWLPGSIPLHEIELVAAEILFGGLFSLGLFALVNVSARPSLRYLAGGLAGAFPGAFIWAVDVSAPGLGLRILAESAAAGFVIAGSLQQSNSVEYTQELDEETAG
jgi:VanZ like family/Concanavalin A-like lectin/glucanases superfamily